MYYAVTRKDDDEPKGRSKRTREEAPKERVLHTRVPAVLEQELKRLAHSLRVPVSNVVRAILEDAVDAVEAEEAEVIEPEEPPCPPEAPAILEGVFGYQPLTLATDTTCSVCGRDLSAGSDALRALFDEPGKRVFLGPECRLVPEKGSRS